MGMCYNCIHKSPYVFLSVSNLPIIPWENKGNVVVGIRLSSHSLWIRRPDVRVHVVFRLLGLDEDLRNVLSGQVLGVIIAIRKTLMASFHVFSMSFAFPITLSFLPQSLDFFQNGSLEEGQSLGLH